MAPLPKTIGGFSVLPLSIPPLPSYPHAATHFLYVRRHEPKNASPDDARSLFVTNIPVDSTEPHFRAVVASLVGPGRFESIQFAADKKSSTASLEPAEAARLAALVSKKRKRKEFDDSDDDSSVNDIEEEIARLPTTWTRPLRRSGSTGVILLADDKSVELVLKAIGKVHKSKKYPVWGEGVQEKVPPLGSHWLAAHNKLAYPPAELLQQSVDAFFTVYNRKEKDAAELAKRLRNEPDEDGFVTVTKASRTAPARRDEAEEARRKMIEKEQKKKDEMGNFYRFQLREKKKAEQAELVKKFDEDRRKVQAMRQRRGNFRPEK
ncbi:ribosomal RNA-processing protein 7-domain-containing protein [Coniella lustricola]|uniref:Ribosomal RNA-processing protein 7-domain-containing protein n=1 Tax=Coniella lustricola TaxID=2025994 RepID=A0A2T3AB06_9PEZI|nr:ribosomal RNA-processing protein 7-domain-containing protein [Coniella lustricola]